MPYDTLEPEEATWPVVKAVCAAIAAILCIALIGFILADSAPNAGEDAGAASCSLHLDCGNAALMHTWGLPTKEDVLEWHLHGQWAYMQDGVLRAYDELPGRAERWDMLYGIDSDNPAFDK